MKNFFYWWAWLQFGMPFVVATGLACAGDWRHAPWRGFLGILFFSPFLLINAIPLAAILSRMTGPHAKIILLGADSAIAFLLVNQGPWDGRILLAGLAWAVASALVIHLALEWEPREEKPDSPDSRLP